MSPQIKMLPVIRFAFAFAFAFAFIQPPGLPSSCAREHVINDSKHFHFPPTHTHFRNNTDQLSLAIRRHRACEQRDEHLTYRVLFSDTTEKHITLSL